MENSSCLSTWKIPLSRKETLWKWHIWVCFVQEGLLNPNYLGEQVSSLTIKATSRGKVKSFGFLLKGRHMNKDYKSVYWLITEKDHF